MLDVVSQYSNYKGKKKGAKGEKGVLRCGCCIYNSQFKMENHAQLAAVGADTVDYLAEVVDAGHLPNAKGIVLLQYGTNLTQALVKTRSGGVELGAAVDGSLRIGEALVLADEVDDV